MNDKGLEQSALQARVANQAKRIPRAVGEFAVGERDQLLAKIAEQDLEVERLNNMVDTERQLSQRQFDVINDLNKQNAALKAQSGAVVMPEPFPKESTPEPGWDAGYEAGYNEACAEKARLNPARGVQEGWTLAADQVPQTGKAVLAYYTNSHGKGRRIRAEYIAAWMVQAEDVSDPDTECVEYSEQDDAYYLTAGWYELIDNWDEYGRIAVTEGVITHWMPLPVAPTPAPTVEPAHSDVRVPAGIVSELDNCAELVELLIIAAGSIREICHERGVPLPKTTLDRIDAKLAELKP